MDTKLDDFSVSLSVKDTWLTQREKTKEIMIGDIVRSIQLDREKVSQDPTLEPFSFSDLVKSASKTIWIGIDELKLMCAEAWFRLLDPSDYRYGHKELFNEGIKL